MTMKLVRRLAVWVVLAGCSGSSNNGSHPPPIGVGHPDQPTTDRLRVDEPGLRGEVSGGTIRLRVPVANDSAVASRGSLSVAVTSVDGRTSATRASLPYDLAAGGNAVLTALVPIPGGIAGQADWAKFNVQVASPDARDLQV